jgi:hypothetical protein
VTGTTSASFDCPPDEAQGDASVLLVGQEASLAGRDDPGQFRVALVGEEDAAQGHAGRGDLFDVDGEAREGGVEDALRDPAHRARLEDLEQLALKLAAGEGRQGQGKQRPDEGHGQRGHQHRTNETEEPDAGGLAGDNLEVPGQAPSGQEHGHQQGHGQAEGEKRRKHVREELQDEGKRHALGDHEIGQVVDAIDQERECEEDEGREEWAEQLADEVAVEDRQPRRSHRSVVP